MRPSAGRWAGGRPSSGRELAAHCAPVSFDDGELVVQADSTAWATQLRLLAATLVRRLNEELGDGTVARGRGPRARRARPGSTAGSASGAAARATPTASTQAPDRGRQRRIGQESRLTPSSAWWTPSPPAFARLRCPQGALVGRSVRPER